MKSLLACSLTLLNGLACAAGVGGQGTWERTLQARDFNGDGTADAYYDTELRITWLDNIRIQYTLDRTFDWGFLEGAVAALNIYGVTGWRLPNTIPVNGVAWDYAQSNNGTTDVGYNGFASELGHLYYVTLGNRSLCPAAADPAQPCVGDPNYGLRNTGPFVELRPTGYWSSGNFEPTPPQRWFFDYTSGYQGGTWPWNAGHFLAVLDGDVSAVPEANTSALLLGGLAAIGCLVARRSRQSPPRACGA